jgi:transposase
MAMGQKQALQPQLFITHDQLPQSAGHPFYAALDRTLTQAGFDPFVEALCAPAYAAPMGRPSIAPGVYFRCLFVGYFEGLRSERGIAWRVSDSLSLRAFLGLALDQGPPDHSTLSRTRRRLPQRMHQQVFDWVLARLGESGLVCGRTLGVDASTLEANAAMRSLERRDTGQSYDEFLGDLAKAEGIENPTKEQCARIDRKRKNKASNADWVNPNDSGARITKMKDGRTHLAYKGEHAVDLDTGAIIAVTVQAADTGDTKSLPVTLAQAETSLVAIREEAAAQARPKSGIEEVVTDKGYHSDEVLQQCADKGIRTYISEPKRNRRWKGKSAQKKATYGNRRRIRGKRGKALLRKRGELVERPFAHRLDRGRLRRLHVRGTVNVYKQELLLSAAQNLGLLMRAKYGVGTPRRHAAQGRQDQRTATGLLGTLLVLLSTLGARRNTLWVPLRTAQVAWQLGYAA